MLGKIILFLRSILRSIRSHWQSIPSIWPYQFLILIGSVIFILFTFALHIEPISFDYSNVSGFFGPGAFWAWVISVLTGFCPNEGLHLMRVIWKEPWEYPLLLKNVSELAPLPAEKKPGESTTDVSNNDSGQDDVLEKDKMDCVQQFLKEVMEDTLTSDEETPPELGMRFSQVIRWARALRLNNRSFFSRREFKNWPDSILLQAECAGHVLDSFGLFDRERTNYPGLVCYRIPKELSSFPRTTKATYQLPQNLRAICPWFTLDDTDFTHYLVEFRNRVEFWDYQNKASRAEIPRNMDANTWAMALYALGSCWVCLFEHGRFKSETWRPEDDAASCVAQIAFGASTLALLSSHPRMPEVFAKFRVSTRSFIWMIVYMHSWFVMFCRGFYVESEWDLPTTLVWVYLYGLNGLLAIRGILLGTLGAALWVAGWFSWFKPRPALNGSDVRMGTWFLCVSQMMLAILLSGGRPQHIVPKIPWTVHAGPPIPKSSASIVDLDQAAALATAFVVLLGRPLQSAIVSLGRALWRGFRAFVLAPRIDVQKRPWALKTIEAILFLARIASNPKWAAKKVVGCMPSVLQLIKAGLGHLRGSSRQRIDGQVMELQRRTTSQMEEGADDKQLRLPRCSPQLCIHVKNITNMGKGPLERKLKFEKKNTDLVKLPKYAKVEKRPIPHAPVASPYAGASVPKVVYVSSSTPFMSAVKRVQKLLIQAEKRATANISLEDTRKSEQQILEELSKVSEKREEVFVKATGRAIEKALNVGKWFEEKATQYVVRIKTGSVLVVDDVVEDEEKKQKEQQKQQQSEKQSQSGPSTDPSKTESQSTATKRKHQDDPAESEDELPESRTRWIKMVEVAVTLK
ncbi:unnamed protein product [Penicillium salamii]|uniref:Uncharacterized protein n=1 Tax=Penicillium salamii TaxID=1612424 RepID=A0A9W4N2V4_9EURO|nr:unnamed protein product [Penicillium salamii]CAG7985339.1 unnamed protein product [Penicillium salamii]CAG8004084.1 unnamed protein product [Penicillium salamii]CAG8244758.1 unnamed protein product [Penicillium salamii]CAG8257800.1 unnamed protein product [Penicillium salamii]